MDEEREPSQRSNDRPDNAEDDDSFYAQDDGNENADDKQ